MFFYVINLSFKEKILNQYIIIINKQNKITRANLILI